MKKTLLILLATLGLITIVIAGILVNRKFAETESKKPNLEFEAILNKEMYGTDVVTIINKARNNNQKYDIQIDDQGNYENDNNYCIEVNVLFKGMEESFSMEQICRAGLEDFMQAFNISKFICTEKGYHTNTGRIAKIVLQEI